MRTRITCLVVLLVSSLAVTMGPAAAADKPKATDLEKVRAYVQPSVVYIGIGWTGYAYDTYNGQWIPSDDDPEAFTAYFQCTGYVVNPNGYVATAAHCVTPDDAVKSSLAAQAANWALANGYYESPDQLTAEGAASDYSIEGADENDGKLIPRPSISWGVTAGGVEASKSYTARVIEKQSFNEGDAALLEINAHGLLPLRLANTSPRVGQDIVAIGYPASVDQVTDLDYAPSFKDGSVSQKKTRGGGLVATYEISAAMSGGMSGGPTVDLDHSVVGTNSFSISGESQQFNFITPAGMTREVMSGAGVKNSLGRIGSEYYAGLDAYFDGDKGSAIEHLQAVVDEQPSNAPAQEFLRKAKRLKGGLPLLPLIAVLGLVVLGGAAGGVSALRRQSRRSEPAMATGASPAAAPAAITTASVKPPMGAAEVTPGADAVKQHLYCSSCGKPLDPGANFCEHCGVKVD